MRHGKSIDVRADTINVHGDRADAGVFAQSLRKSLKHMGLSMPRFEPTIGSTTQTKALAASLKISADN